MVPLVSLLFLLLVIGAIASAATVLVMARALTRPPRMTDGKAAYLLKRLSPGDIGLAFEDVSFTVRDERTGAPLKLAGWWMPNPRANGRCAVLVHGYADAKVGAIAWAPTWHALGFNVLAIDLRAHGNSGGDLCSAGFFERHDLSAVVGEVRSEKPADARRVVLVGISLGACAALGAAALREGVAEAVVLDSPIADFRTAALAHFDLLGLPGRAFQRAAVRVAAWLTGADFGAIAPLALLGQVSCPVMVIAPAEDVFVSPEEARQFQSVLGARGSPLDDYWAVGGTRHLEALYVDPGAYRQRVGAFVDAALDTAALAPPLSVTQQTEAQRSPA